MIMHYQAVEDLQQIKRPLVQPIFFELANTRQSKSGNKIQDNFKNRLQESKVHSLNSLGVYDPRFSKTHPMLHCF